jgi:ribosome-associated heat shock protein Hsp15
MQGQRLDKWLWCARLVKTRTLAAKLIEDGRVRINGERVLKISRHVRLGDVVTATIARRLVVLRVTGEAERRGAASLARTLYEDLTPPTSPSEPQQPGGTAKGPRPTKRDRRRFERERVDAMDAKDD